MKEHLLELYEERPNFGKLENKTHEIKMKNPYCDDEINLELEIKNNKIKDAKFSGKTCFISTVSASALTQEIKGKTLDEAKKLTQNDLDKLLKTKVISTRIKCQLFPLEALRKIK